LKQLQRYSRGAIRPLWKIWSNPVCAGSHIPQPSGRTFLLTLRSQIRQGIANNTKGTAFVVYEDVMDAKQACDKLNGFNFQNRYLVGMLGPRYKSTENQN